MGRNSNSSGSDDVPLRLLLAAGLCYIGYRRYTAPPPPPPPPPQKTLWEQGHEYYVKRLRDECELEARLRGWDSARLVYEKEQSAFFGRYRCEATKVRFNRT